jgi:predicted SAM-dependent methyltransferase
MTEPALALAAPTLPVKLDLGCGQSPKEGFEGVDLHAPDVKYRVDLWKFPFPWEDNSVDELYSSHFVEHLPAREVEMRDLARSPEDMALDPHGVLSLRHEPALGFVGQDFLFAFFDECYRILKPNASMLVVVPNARSNRGFQDPTHRRFIVAETFGYLAKDWREANKLNHYNVRCDFASNITPIVPTELTLLHPEAQMRRFNESWNTVLDWHAILIARK